MLKTFKKRYKRFSRKVSTNSRVCHYRKYVSTPQFAHRYFLFSIIILFASVSYWAFLSAKIQISNADNLVNAMLFESSGTFHGALIPNAHTFLIKWPLFIIVKSAGLTSNAYIAATMALVLTTVGVFARILYKIEHRPHQIGTIFLGMSSVLMLVPTAAYSGALLPVNMSMIATRNIEYVLFIAALMCVIKARNSIRSRYAWLAVLLLSLLFASDGLFLRIDFGASILLLLIYVAAKKWDFVKIWLRWLVITMFSIVLSVAILKLITHLGVTTIVGSSALGPYGIVNSAKAFATGTGYAVLGILTNFGANPAFDVMTLKDVPSQLITRLFTPSGLAYAVNSVFLVAIIGYAVRLVRASFAQKPRKAKTLRIGISLSIMLLAVSAASIGLFIVSNHYYPADARYLGIIFFAGFICITTFSSAKRWKPLTLSIVGGIFFISIVIGGLSNFKIFHENNAALAQTNSKDYRISQALESHKVKILVGDYWRVIPTKFISGNSISIAPLTNCSEYRSTLTSKTWQPDLHNTSFAYILSLKKGLTDFPACSYEEVLINYGRPSSSALISGTLDNPDEILLFYDTGKHPLGPKQISVLQKDSLSAIPKPLSEVNGVACSSAQTVMQVVAHEDDDLLFMSPDLLNDIAAKKCVITIYLTAGDSGSNSFYWLKREQGSEAAYSYMIGSSASWSQKNIKLPNGQFASFASPRRNPRITLIFLRLPDGGLNGGGFPEYGHESIGKIVHGSIPIIHSVDAQSHYSRKELESSIAELMKAFAPTSVRAQSSNRGDGSITDHSDHNATGSLTANSFYTYSEQQPEGSKPTIAYYLGYPERLLPTNLSVSDIQQKTEAFIRYAGFDSAVCRSTVDCKRTATYHGYLSRQYLSPS